MPNAHLRWLSARSLFTAAGVMLVFLTVLALFALVFREAIATAIDQTDAWISAEDGRELTRSVLRDHFAAVVGLPLAAVLSLILVGSLRISGGPIEFEIGSVKVRGAAGPVTLWVLCFLAIAVAIKLLW